MSDNKAMRGRKDVAPKSSDGEGWGSATWIERLGRKGGRLPAGRHTAITRNLYSYASYKSWADKVRSTWDPTQGPVPGSEPEPKKS